MTLVSHLRRELAPTPKKVRNGCCGVAGPNPQPLSIRTHVFSFAAVILDPPPPLSRIFRNAGWTASILTPAAQLPPLTGFPAVHSIDSHARPTEHLGDRVGRSVVRRP